MVSIMAICYGSWDFSEAGIPVSICYYIGPPHRLIAGYDLR
jgi:hypothetical protein